MKNMHGFIYITTNCINGKQYIGQCSFSKADWKSYLGSGKWLKKAITKYGRENFAREIIFFAFTQNDSNKIEELLIAEYDAVKSRKFYNIQPKVGSTSGFKGKKHTEEFKKARSEEGKKRLATQAMRDNMRLRGTAPRTEKQIAHSTEHFRILGLLNRKEREIRIYVCPICKEFFEREEHKHKKRKDGDTCSKECRGKKIGISKSKPKEFKKYNCPNCQKEFQREEYVHHERKEGHCCSVRCARLLMGKIKQ